jgi:hypothetical protein
MTPSTRNANKHTKARTRRRLTAQERLARDCRQAQHATEALQQALDDLGLSEDLVTEIGPVTTFLSSGIVEHLKNAPFFATLAGSMFASLVHR